MKRKHIIGWVLGITILGFITLFASFIFSPEINNYFNRIEFDSAKWKNWEESETNPSLRWNMVHDLVKDHELVGMNLNEIKELLGKPDHENKKFISYYLGMSGYGIDTGALYLELRKGIVVEVRIWHG